MAVSYVIANTGGFFIMNNLHKWDYEGDEICYGEEISYKKAADFLGADEPMEDWGCGTMWAKYYFTNYKGIDGSLSKQVKEVIDLTEYTSSIDNILIRQTLEHNYEWKKILENIQKSFKKKVCLSIHVPFADETKVIGIDPTNQVPFISFKLEDITDYFKGCKITIETIPTHFEYGEETLIYVEK